MVLTSRFSAATTRSEVPATPLSLRLGAPVSQRYRDLEDAPSDAVQKTPNGSAGDAFTGGLVALLGQQRPCAAKQHHDCCDHDCQRHKYEHRHPRLKLLRIEDVPHTVAVVTCQQRYGREANQAHYSEH